MSLAVAPVNTETGINEVGASIPNEASRNIPWLEHLRFAQCPEVFVSVWDVTENDWIHIPSTDVTLLVEPGFVRLQNVYRLTKKECPGTGKNRSLALSYLQFIPAETERMVVAIDRLNVISNDQYSRRDPARSHLAIYFQVSNGGEFARTLEQYIPEGYTERARDGADSLYRIHESLESIIARIDTSTSPDSPIAHTWMCVETHSKRSNYDASIANLFVSTTFTLIHKNRVPEYKPLNPNMEQSAKVSDNNNPGNEIGGPINLDIFSTSNSLSLTYRRLGTIKRDHMYNKIPKVEISVWYPAHQTWVQVPIPDVKIGLSVNQDMIHLETSHRFPKRNEPKSSRCLLLSSLDFYIPETETMQAYINKVDMVVKEKKNKIRKRFRPIFYFKVCNSGTLGVMDANQDQDLLEKAQQGLVSLRRVQQVIEHVFRDIAISGSATYGEADTWIRLECTSMRVDSDFTISALTSPGTQFTFVSNNMIPAFTVTTSLNSEQLRNQTMLDRSLTDELGSESSVEIKEKTQAESLEAEQGSSILGTRLQLQQLPYQFFEPKARHFGFLECPKVLVSVWDAFRQTWVKISSGFHLVVCKQSLRLDSIHILREYNKRNACFPVSSLEFHILQNDKIMTHLERADQSRKRPQRFRPILYFRVFDSGILKRASDERTPLEARRELETGFSALSNIKQALDTVLEHGTLSTHSEGQVQHAWLRMRSEVIKSENDAFVKSCLQPRSRYQHINRDMLPDHQSININDPESCSASVEDSPSTEATNVPFLSSQSAISSDVEDTPSRPIGEKTVESLLEEQTINNVELAYVERELELFEKRRVLKAKQEQIRAMLERSRLYHQQ